MRARDDMRVWAAVAIGCALLVSIGCFELGEGVVAAIVGSLAAAVALLNGIALLFVWLLGKDWAP